MSDPGDALEIEADQVADQVMRMTSASPAEPPLTRGSGERVDRACAACKEEDELLQRTASGPAGEAVAPQIVHDVLRTPGRPLDPATRAFMEPRFGYDFAGVRVHAGPQATASARAVSAMAYTVGSNIVFGAGQFQPQTDRGRRLLAHELAHTIQQGGPQMRPQLQRKCGTALGEPVPDCTLSTKGVAGEQFFFNVNCDEPKPGEDAHVEKFVKGLKPGTTLQVHGYASEEGTPEFNLALSCHRVNMITGMMQKANAYPAPALNFTGFFKHGPQPGGPRDFWRSVIVEETRPTPQPDPQPKPETPPKKPKGTPGGGIDDCAPEHIPEVQVAFAEARNGIAATADAIMKDPMDSKTKAAFTKYMGASAKPAHVAIRLREIGRGLKHVKIECENPGSTGYDKFCPPGTLAYTRNIAWWVGVGNIHVCQPQFHNLTEDQRAGTLVHEGSHRFNGTDDKGYYNLNCTDTPDTLKLSDSDRDNNADCYGCLVQSLL